MVGILKFLRQDDRWNQLDEALSGAFEKIKGESQNLYSWVRYFRQKEIASEAKQERLNNEVLEQQVQIKILKSELDMLKEEVKYIRNSQKAGSFPDQVRTKSEPESVHGFAQRVLAISRPVKKDYVMRQIIELAQKKAFSTKQIEFVIVRERMLCGRTAFYDYLRELRLKKQIEEVENGSKRVLVSRI